MIGARINGIFVKARDTFSGREASEYVSVRYDNIPGGCSTTARFYGTLPDGTEEEVDVYTCEKLGDPVFYIRRAVWEIEKERGIHKSSKP